MRGSEVITRIEAVKGAAKAGVLSKEEAAGGGGLPFGSGAGLLHSR